MPEIVAESEQDTSNSGLFGGTVWSAGWSGVPKRCWAGLRPGPL